MLLPHTLLSPCWKKKTALDQYKLTSFTCWSMLVFPARWSTPQICMSKSIHKLPPASKFIQIVSCVTGLYPQMCVVSSFCMHSSQTAILLYAYLLNQQQSAKDLLRSFSDLASISLSSRANWQTNSPRTGADKVSHMSCVTWHECAYRCMHCKILTLLLVMLLPRLLLFSCNSISSLWGARPEGQWWTRTSWPQTRWKLFLWWLHTGSKEIKNQTPKRQPDNALIKLKLSFIR